MDIIDLLPAGPHYKQGATLLASAGLLTADIEGRGVRLWALMDESTLIGIAGLERSGTIGLLRSLAISDKYRGRGHAKQLCDHVSMQAHKDNLQDLYLLTETASGFFAKIGYVKIDRSDAPADLQNTPQFSSLCPGTATVMVKRS